MTYGQLTNDSGHILIAGATGSGKSVFLNGFINSALRQGCYMFIALDPKRVELSHLKGVRTCLYYASSESDCVTALRRAVAIMEERYKDMEAQGVKRSQDSDLLIVIDELADLLISPSHKEIELLIQKIAQLGRAARCRLILCTQAPNRSILKASIILNINIRIALHCNSPIESRQILGFAGAEQLAPYGQAIIKSGSTVEVVEVPMTTDEETEQAIRQSNGLNANFKPVRFLSEETNKPPIPNWLWWGASILLIYLIGSL